MVTLAGHGEPLARFHVHRQERLDVVHRKDGIVRLRTLLLATVLVVTTAASAAAQSAGVRTGVSGGPDQFYVGLHYETEPLIEQVRFKPNVEVGIGSSQTLLAINLEFVGKVPINREPWAVYLGGGPALIIDNANGAGTNTGGGFNILFGLEHQKGLFTELKVGVADSPGVKFSVGYIFGGASGGR
jgi:hypothetical protein